MNDVSDTQSSAEWVKNARQFLDFNYDLVPIEPTLGVSKDVEDPVVRRLRHKPLVRPYAAVTASTRSELEKLGKQFEEAKVAALTGEESDLLVLELNKGGRDDDPFYQRLNSYIDGVTGVASSSREYIFFPYPDVEEPLPAITEKEGAVLHGQDSLVHLPGGIYKWRDTFFNSDGESVFRGERKTRSRTLVKLFGLKDHLAPEEETAPEERDTDQPSGRTKEVAKDSTQLDLPLGRQSTNGDSEKPGDGSLFRSGSNLQVSSERKSGRLNVPWTVPGGFSVLTGPPKTAGKSSWVLNLAVHLAAGEPFFGFENTPSEVVFLADTSPANLRELLAQFSFVDRDGALSRLHVLHPKDVVRLDWRSTLSRVYKHVNRIGADILIVDCLDRYVRLKGGRRPTESEEVVHKLTAESPPQCPVLGVKSTECTPEESLSATIDRLGLLGVSADAIVRLDDISTETFPCLRRLVTVSRRGAISQTHFCSLRSGRYVRVRQSDLSGLSTQNLLNEPAPSTSLRDRSAGSDPLLLS